ncbi:methyltransferase type 11 [Grosmannia clavigera kw1407]|uniref:Methyltransferase type 11 n=1 Tax=Grosmannia clavigera (strain kw1407 / UAMH 11150) TaxID=655863 RepID=F0X7B4_GROCL|nr:methyltransferase type 11 [Grosmannia clavigera kw1407]EFX06485.1 methyltransferase type 11 [Grosmannia clavigera kw1407]
MEEETSTAPEASPVTRIEATPAQPAVNEATTVPPVAQAASTVLPANHWVQQDEENPVDTDADSTYSISDELSSTASITSSILRYREINGRTYHAEQGDVQYWASNDETQSESMDINHHVLLLSTNNKLYFAPLKDDVHRVLDIGTGTGMWAIDFADDHPGAEVIGTDISPIQPIWVPPNTKFELEDFTQPWTFPENSFDYVHMRWLYGSVPDWTKLIREAYRVLKPGGWIESSEATPLVESDDNSVLPGSAMHEWGKLFLEGGDLLGRTFRIIEKDLQRKGMQEAGFDEASIGQWDFKCPVGGWSDDPHLKQIGQYVQLTVESDISGYVGFIGKLVAGWSETEVAIYSAQLRRDMRSGKHAYYRQRVVWAQKPLA